MDAPTIGLISLCVTSATALGLAWIAFRQASLSKAVEEVKKQTDGINSALVARASHAEGVVAGKAEEKAEAAATPPQPV